MFRGVSQSSFDEMDTRKGLRSELLSFGIKFLDDATLGIWPSDLILIGAPAGVGKTQFCCNLALANIERGKRVHYIALEAETYEIEQRIKFQLFSKAFFENTEREFIPIDYAGFLAGDYLPGGKYEELAKLENIIAKEFAEKYQKFFLFYKDKNFGTGDLVENILNISQETDLIIVDHVHYFDFEDDNENRSMREIAKTARTLALEERKPIVLVAHLRKKNNSNNDLVAGMEEFHGTSDLYKIATKVVTFAPGGPIGNKMFATYFRIPKNRINGSVTRYMAQVPFNLKGNNYEPEYKIAPADCIQFEELAHGSLPDWARKSTHVRTNPVAKPIRQQKSFDDFRGQKDL